MIISEEMKSAIKTITELDGYKCHGLVNYIKKVSALNEDSDPTDPSNFFPQQCTAIIDSIFSSLKNLNGGIPDKLIVESTNMTMLISLVNDTYFCGIGLEPNIDYKKASFALEVLRKAIRLQY